MNIRDYKAWSDTEAEGLDSDPSAARDKKIGIWVMVLIALFLLLSKCSYPY